MTIVYPLKLVMGYIARRSLLITYLVLFVSLRAWLTSLIFCNSSVNIISHSLLFAPASHPLSSLLSVFLTSTLSFGLVPQLLLTHALITMDRTSNVPEQSDDRHRRLSNKIKHSSNAGEIVVARVIVTRFNGAVNTCRHWQICQQEQTNSKSCTANTV